MDWYDQDKAHRLDGRPFGSPKGEYRPHVAVAGLGLVDIIAYVEQHGHGPNGPRNPSVRPYDLFDGPLPGQSLEDWKRAIQGEYYRPPA